MSTNADLTPAEAAQNLGPTVVWVISLFAAMTTLIVLLRLYTRMIMLKVFLIDDYLIILSMAIAYVMAFGPVAAVHYGLGRHMGVLNPYQIEKYTQLRFFYILAWNLSLAITKLSILTMYRRVFYTTYVKLGSEIMMGVISIVMTYAIIMTLVQCKPISYYWNQNQPGHCASPFAFWDSTAALNMISDIIIICLPMRVIVKLQLDMRSKFQLAGVFSLGAVVIAISAIRLPTIVSVAHTTDFSWVDGPAAIWSATEVLVAICCPSLSALRPLFVKAQNSMRNISTHSQRLGSSAEETSKMTPLQSLGAKMRVSRVRDTQINQDAQDARDARDDPVQDLDSDDQEEARIYKPRPPTGGGSSQA